MDLKKLKPEKNDIVNLANYCIEIDNDGYANENAYRTLAQLILLHFGSNNK